MESSEEPGSPESPSSSASNIQKIQVPRNLVNSDQGFSIDYGGSVIKIAYRTKEDFEKASQTGNDGTGTLRLVSFARAEMESALNYIRTHAHNNKPDEPGSTLIYTTGNGCSQYRDLIESKLNCKLKNVTEFDCLVDGFQLLASTLPIRHFVLPPLTDVMDEQVEHLKRRVVHWNGLSSSGLTRKAPSFTPDSMAYLERLNFDQNEADLDKPILETENIYPCIIASLGSLFNFWKVSADGSFEFLEGSDFGGLAFYGLGTLLTGCKSFDELVELGCSGDPLGVDVGNKDMMAGKTDDKSIYSTFGKGSGNTTLFPFGKAVGKSIDDFRREDLAASLMRTVLSEACLITQTVAEEAGIMRVFFVGSFTKFERARKVITSGLTKRNGRKYICKGRGGGLKFDFVRDGAYLSCIGALQQHTASETDDIL